MKNPMEIILFALVIIYLVTPVRTPYFISDMVDSPLGMILIFFTIVYLFIYSHIVLGVLFILVAGKLVHSSERRPVGGAKIQYTPNHDWYRVYDDNLIRPIPDTSGDVGSDKRYIQYGFDNQLKLSQDSVRQSWRENDSLETDIVSQRAPLQPLSNDYLDTRFKPVMDNIHNATET